MKTLLIANRGEIACRIMQTAREQGLKTIAVYSDVDVNALHVARADEAVCIGGKLASESYLNIDSIIDAALKTSADAIHPGYGFLSENPDFVEACEAHNITFVGPSSTSMRAMGRKDAAKRLMEEAGVPVVPGYHGENQDGDFLEDQAVQIGYPVLIKARSGGGGKGMRQVNTPDEFAAALVSAKRESLASFGDDHVLIEKFVAKPRHIEVQVFGDNFGKVVHLFERDCSLQRRHQKVIEEAPAPDMTPEVRAAMTEAAVKAAKAINYSGAGTIEFIVDTSAGLRTDGFWFMEMNTRLQVEHPVTESITGVDLVDWQLQIAAGLPLPCAQKDLHIRGHSVEARLYAENPDAGFLPASGTLHCLEFSEGGRTDSGVAEGDEVLSFYDPLVAKLISHGPDRHSAFNALSSQLAETVVLGTSTNREFLWRLVNHPKVLAVDFDTSFIPVNLTDLTRQQPMNELSALAVHALAGSPSRPKGALTLAESLGNWEIWTDRSRLVALNINGSEHTFLWQASTQGRFAASDNSSKSFISSNSVKNFPTSGIVVTTLNNSKFDIDGVLRTGRVVEDDTAIHVHWGPWSYSFEKVQLGISASDSVRDGVILAPMPARIVAVQCEVGDKVQAGQPLLSIEAMKMEQDLSCSRDGVVESVAVSIGDQIQQGAELLRLAEN